MKEYINFLAKYQKTYASAHDIKNRYMKFKSNYEMIEEHNSKEDSTFEMGITEFSDMTKEEFEQSLKGILISPEHSRKVKPLPSVDRKFLLRDDGYSNDTILPEYVNWYKDGKVTRPMN